MNSKINFLLTLLLISSSVLFSQTKEQALKDAKITSVATLNMDFGTVLKYTYPPILDLMGGKENAEKTIEEVFNTMKTQGLVFEKAEVISVSEVIFEQNQYRCVVEGFNQIKMINQRISSKSYLLGIYNTKDKFWWFLEAKQLKNKAMVDQILPDFKTSLDIPEDDMKVETIKD